MERVACKKCGALILPDTAKRNDGLCTPCKGGFRERIEAGKLRQAQEREFKQSPERRFWLDLVSRAHAYPDGLTKLSSAEKTYYSVSCLIGEVYNGGFEQFFFNSAGSMYGFSSVPTLFEEEQLVSGRVVDVVGHDLRK
jgi:hypothetical protein